MVYRVQKGADRTALEEARDLLRVVADHRTGLSRVPVCQAQISELLGNTNDAIAKYKHAVLDLGERNPTVIRRAVELLAEQQRYQEADQMLQMLQKFQQQTGAPGDLNRVAAEIALSKQDRPQALLLAQKAVDANSKNYRDHLWLALILSAAGQLAEAESSFQRATSLAGHEPAPWVAYTQFLVRRDHTGDKQKAEATIREAEQKLPKDAASLALAQCYQVLGNKDEAKKRYEAALAAHPDDVAVHRSAALFYLSLNDDKAKTTAISHLEKVIELGGKTSREVAKAKRELAIVLASLGDFQQQQKALAVLGVVDKVDQVEVGEQESVETVRARVAILAAQPGFQPKRQAVETLERLQRRQPLEVGEQFLLAQLYESTGEGKKARAQLVSLLSTTADKLDKNPNQKDLEAAYSEYLAYACELFLRHNELNAADLWLEKLEKLRPNMFRTVALKARMLAKRDRAAKAVRLLQTVVKTDAKFLQPVAVLLEEIGENAAAQPLYEQLASQPGRPENVLALAMFFGRQNLPEKALDLCEKAWQTCRPELVGEACMVVLYVAKANEQQYQRVVGWLEDAIAKDPKGTRLLDQLATVRRLQGRYPETIALYRRILEINEADPHALNNLAWLLALKEGKGEEALQLMKKALDLGGRVAESLDTRGVIYLTLGQGDLAVKDLEQVVAEKPSRSHYFHLARAYQQVKDPRAALQFLDKAVSLGLTEQSIDPLEQAAYRRLMADLGQK
jgi:tetratricopeptide (TPR) repeat protein